jgi:hypothetical protein
VFCCSAHLAVCVYKTPFEVRCAATQPFSAGCLVIHAHRSHCPSPAEFSTPSISNSVELFPQQEILTIPWPHTSTPPKLFPSARSHCVPSRQIVAFRVSQTKASRFVVKLACLPGLSKASTAFTWSVRALSQVRVKVTKPFLNLRYHKVLPSSSIILTSSDTVLIPFDHTHTQPLRQNLPNLTPTPSPYCNSRQ